MSAALSEQAIHDLINQISENRSLIFMDVRRSRPRFFLGHVERELCPPPASDRESLLPVLRRLLEEDPGRGAHVWSFLVYRRGHEGDPRYTRTCPRVVGSRLPWMPPNGKGRAREARHSLQGAAYLRPTSPNRAEHSALYGARLHEGPGLLWACSGAPVQSVRAASPPAAPGRTSLRLKHNPAPDGV